MGCSTCGGRSRARPEQVLIRTVDYCLGRYEDAERPNFLAGSAVSTVRGWLAEGYYVLDGTALVDGRELIRLREVASSTVKPPTGVVYIDPDTLLPVRWVDDDSTGTIEYLPRSPESLALLVPPIPDGFTQGADTPTSDAAATMSC